MNDLQVFIGISLSILSAFGFYILWRKEKKLASEYLHDRGELGKSNMAANSLIQDYRKALALAEAKNQKSSQLFTAPAAPGWESSDNLNLNRFLKTDTGSKLMQRGRALEYRNALAGCNDVFHTVHSASKAAGFSECLNWIESCASQEMLSRVSGDSEAKTKNTSDFPQDEEALLEKYSP